MNEEIFDLKNFNVISDDEYYYVFRSLNNADHKDIQEEVTADSEGIQIIRTDRERWEETNGQKARFSDDAEISLDEVWNHIKKNYSKETNCISLSSNTNVSIDYGKGYHEEYVMIKVSKSKSDNIIYAGQYMLSELSKRIDEIVKDLPENSEILSLFREIDSNDSADGIRTIADDIFKKAKSEGHYIGSNRRLDSKISIRDRFSKKQYFSNEQQTEYNKVIAKLTILELYGQAKNILSQTRDNSSLIATIGMAFSSGELIHYKDIQKDEFVEVSKEMMDVLSLLQQAKDTGRFDTEKINEFEKRLISFINDNKNFEIDNEEKGDEIDLDNLTIEDIYNATDGEINYEKARQTVEFVTNLIKARKKSLEYTDKIKEEFDQNNEFDEIIDFLRERGVIIDQNIITRENGQGVRIAESVNLGLGRNGYRTITNTEQRKAINQILGISTDEISQINISDLKEIYDRYISGTIEAGEKKSENTYYAEAIVDSLDFSKIYRNAISDERKVIHDDERSFLIEMLEKADCKRLYNAFIKSGINYNEIGGYIINLLMNNGYKGYSFEELSRAEDLKEIISVNIKNTMLKNRIPAFRMDELLENVDNSNIVEGTNIKLRDYQQETVENIDKIFENKRFAGVILPTGAGKSFVAITEMLKYKDKNIIYFAPQKEILNQVQRHILKHVLGVQVLTEKEIQELNGKEPPEGKIYPKQINEYISKAFPHLKMYCYQSLTDRNGETNEKELREILANSDADLMVFDELHRTGAETWEPRIKELMDRNPQSKVLGITATPIRDSDKKDMMETLATFSGDYTQEEIARGEYLAKEMYLVDAIQEGLVVEPNIVSFNFSLGETEEYKEVQRMYKEEKDPSKKEKLKAILNQMEEIINDTSDIQNLLMNEEDPEKRKSLEEQFSKIRKEIKSGNIEGIREIITKNIVKKDGRYIVFLPQNTTKLPTEEYIKQEIEKAKEYFKDIDPDPEIEYLMHGKDKNNIKAISNFENSDSPHIKLLFAIDKLNEGVHIDGINGELMLRKIGEGSRILYLQQLGRVIFALDPDNPIKEEDIPIVFDVYNNYIAQNMSKEINKRTPTSDLQRLQSIIKWMNKHGYFPDINSEQISEARKAIHLKKIQQKYNKYRELTEIDNSKLSKKEKYEIEQIIQLANSIELFDTEIPERIIPPGEKDIGEVQIFKVTGSQKKFLDLFKQARDIDKHKKLGIGLRIRTTLNILQTLNDYGLDINNETIPEDATLGDVLKQLPENIRRAALEDADIGEDYEIGQEYNVTKAAFTTPRRNMIFLDYDVRDLRRYGIFERTNGKFFGKGREIVAVDDDFIVRGKKELIGLNIKTGTYYDEEGYKYKGCNDKHFDREGYFWNENYSGELVKTTRKYNNYGFDKDDIYVKNGTPYDDLGFDARRLHKDTGKPYDSRFFDEHRNWVKIKEDGTYEFTDQRYNPDGWDVQGLHKDTGEIYDNYDFREDRTWKDTGKIYNDRMLTREGYRVIVDEKTGEVTVTDKPYDARHFNLDGYWVDVKEDGTYVVTDKKYNPDRWDMYGNYVDEQDGQDIFTGKPYNNKHLTEEGYWVNVEENGRFKITKEKPQEMILTSKGKLTTYEHHDEQTGKTIRFMHKEVADFIFSGMSKRGYCGEDGLKIRALNELIEEERRGNPEVVDLIQAADRRAPSIDLEVKPKIVQLQKEVKQGKLEFEQMKARGATSKQLKAKANAVNAKARELNMWRLTLAQYRKEEAKKKEEEAKALNEEAKKLKEEYEKQAQKKPGNSENPGGSDSTPKPGDGTIDEDMIGG